MDIPAGMQVMTGPAGDYAEFTHVGPIATFWQTVNYAHGWMAQNGYKGDRGFSIELCSKADVDAPDFELPLLLPLRK